MLVRAPDIPGFDVRGFRKSDKDIRHFCTIFNIQMFQNVPSSEHYLQWELSSQLTITVYCLHGLKLNFMT